MMKYITRSAALFIDENGETSITADQIIEPEDQTPQASGLLDQWGNQLYRVKEKIQFGFVGKDGR